MIETLAEFSELIGYDLDELEGIRNKTHLHYKSWKIVKRDASGAPKRTKSGKIKMRPIDAPFGILKGVQKAIKKQVLDPLALPPQVYGVKKKGAVSNANVHRGKPYHFHLDLSNFYPSVSAKMVYKALLRKNFSVPVSRMIRDLVTFGGRLTQGAPTSPMIANIVMLPIDQELVHIAKTNRLTYTRYVDNIAFSGSMDFHHLCGDIIEVIELAGLQRNHEDTFYKKGPFTLTGPWVKQNILDVEQEIKEKANDLTRNVESRIGYLNYIKDVKKVSTSKSHK